MDKNRLLELKNGFDLVLHSTTEEQVEYWCAREIMPLLGYVRWENFVTVIERAQTACEKSGVRVSDQFRDVTKLIEHGKGGKREISDYYLTRYACYLIAMNGDPRKEQIAFAQSYFAVQTRKVELIEERVQHIERFNVREQLSASERRLSKNIYERGVDDQGFARIRSRGDQALFGMPTAVMKKRLGMPEKRPLADFLPTLTIAAKNLATEMTNYNVEQKDLHGEAPITVEHEQNNRSVRNMLGERGIKPEELPPAEDIKKVERRVKSSERQLVANCGKLPERPANNESEDKIV